MISMLSKRAYTKVRSATRKEGITMAQPKILDTNIAQNGVELIGNTPLLQLNRYAHANNLIGTVLAKLEYRNPAGSSRFSIGFP